MIFCYSFIKPFSKSDPEIASGELCVHFVMRLFMRLRCSVINIYFPALRHSGALLLQSEYKSHIVINLTVSACTSQRRATHSFTMH